MQNGNGLEWTLDYNIDIFERNSIELFFNEIISLMKNIEVGEMTVSDYVWSITDKEELAEHYQFLEGLNDMIDTDF